VVAFSFAHIKASIVPMPVSLTDPNSDAADSDIRIFRDNSGLSPTFAEPANAGMVRNGTRKRANTEFFMTFSSGWDARRPVTSQNARVIFSKSV
jgi:hypothetical protein